MIIQLYDKEKRYCEVKETIQEILEWYDPDDLYWQVCYNICQVRVSVNSITRGKSWLNIDDLEQNYSQVIATLGRECLEWALGETDEAVEALISYNSQDGDAFVFTDWSKGEKSLAGLSLLDAEGRL